MYFQKAIQECESEWADNVKLISLREKGLRRSIPKGLPYFHVDFGMDDGFAHVIEDENTFPTNFAQGKMLRNSCSTLETFDSLYRNHWRNAGSGACFVQRPQTRKF